MLVEAFTRGEKDLKKLDRMNKEKLFNSNSLNNFLKIKNMEELELEKPIATPLNDMDNRLYLNNYEFECFISFEPLTKLSKNIVFKGCYFKSGFNIWDENIGVEFEDCIFQFLNIHQTITYKNLIYKNCLFLSEVKIDSFSSLKGRNYLIEGNIFLFDVYFCCSNFMGSKLDFDEFVIKRNRFNQNLRIKYIHTENKMIFEDNEIIDGVLINDCKFKGKTYLINNSINKNRLYSLKGNIYNGNLSIDFEGVKGKILFTESILPEGVFFNEDSIKFFNYDQLKITDIDFIENNRKDLLPQEDKVISSIDLGYLISKWNFYNIAELFNKTSNRPDEKSKCLYYYKKYDRLKRKNKYKIMKYPNNKIKTIERIKLLQDYIIEYTTGYFTSLVRVIGTSMAIILIYGVLNYICYDSFGKEINGNKIVNSLYFSIISFTTIGYGDLSHSNEVMKIMSGIEGLLGITLTATFITTIVRKYVN